MPFERRLDAGGVEQPEGDVQGFAEAPVVVVINVPGVHYEADPESRSRPPESGRLAL